MVYFSPWENMPAYRLDT